MKERPTSNVLREIQVDITVMELPLFRILIIGLTLVCFYDASCDVEHVIESTKMYNKALSGYELQRTNVSSFFECLDECMRNKHCESINFHRKNEEQTHLCELNYVSKSDSKEDEIQLKPGADFYDLSTEEISQLLLGHVACFNNKSSSKPTKEKKVFSKCLAAKKDNPSSQSGLYWIDPDGGSPDNAFQVYCDMDTSDGGWTLVWSYTFINYHQFDSYTNAVTPVPTWHLAGSIDVNISRKVPQGEIDYGAMDFPKWRNIGVEVLIKSNINNWILCTPAVGNFVLFIQGEMVCAIVKEVSNNCKGYRAPNALEVTNYGPAFTKDGKKYYYFEGSIFSNFPVHDPCGEGKNKENKNVANPRGNLYIR